MQVLPCLHTNICPAEPMPCICVPQTRHRVGRGGRHKAGEGAGLLRTWQMGGNTRRTLQARRCAAQRASQEGAPAASNRKSRHLIVHGPGDRRCTTLQARSQPVWTLDSGWRLSSSRARACKTAITKGGTVRPVQKTPPCGQSALPEPCGARWLVQSTHAGFPGWHGRRGAGAERWTLGAPLWPCLTN